MAGRKVLTIAVIGHGRSPEGKYWGRKIDDCETVVRMWDWHWQQPDDYGEQYDYGVVALLRTSIVAFLNNNEREPKIEWLGYLRGPVDMKLLPDMRIIDQRYRDEAVRLGGKPNFNLTRGCAAACWALNQAEAGEDVVLVGFDNLRAGVCLETSKAFSAEYQRHYDRLHPNWRHNMYFPGSKICGSHDMTIERPLLETLAKRWDINLRFAEDIW
jgi:hypothetical protein